MPSPSKISLQMFKEQHRIDILLIRLGVQKPHDILNVLFLRWDLFLRLDLSLLVRLSALMSMTSSTATLRMINSTSYPPPQISPMKRVFSRSLTRHTSSFIAVTDLDLKSRAGGMFLATTGSALDL